MNRRGSYWINLLLGLDYFVATLFGIPAGVYISSYVPFKRIDSNNHWFWRKCESFINWLFKDPNHCSRALAMNKQDVEYFYGRTL